MLLAKKILLSVFVAVASAANAASRSEQPTEEFCSTAREFIGSHRYLLEKKELGLSPEQAFSAADKISKGCTGAAKRFAQVFETLFRFEIPSQQAFSTAMKFSSSSDAKTQSFLTVLKTAYLKEYLDLDLTSSLKLAHSLSDEFDGDSKRAENDFQKIVSFCLQQEGLGLPKAKCASLAGRVAKYGQRANQEVASAFIKAYLFLREEKSLNLNVAESIARSEEIMKASPYAVDNFIQAYRYGLKEGGLDFNTSRSLAFAQEVANRVSQPTTEKNGKSERQPANH